MTKTLPHHHLINLLACVQNHPYLNVSIELVSKSKSSSMCEAANSCGHGKDHILDMVGERHNQVQYIWKNTRLICEIVMSSCHLCQLYQSLAIH
jgi:hypothetical protein